MGFSSNKVKVDINHITNQPLKAFSFLSFSHATPKRTLLSFSLMQQPIRHRTPRDYFLPSFEPARDPLPLRDLTIGKEQATIFFLFQIFPSMSMFFFFLFPFKFSLAGDGSGRNQNELAEIDSVFIQAIPSRFPWIQLSKPDFASVLADSDTNRSIPQTMLWTNEHRCLTAIDDWSVIVAPMYS